MDFSRERKDRGGEDARTSSSPSGEADDDDDNKLELHQEKHRAAGDDDDEGTRQPYKCSFCRRGFPTAQALGGHMNVHRRHRGRPAAAAPQGSTGGASQPYCYSATPPAVVASLGQTHPAVSGTSSSSAATALLHAERRRPCELRLFGRDDCAAAGRGKEGGTEGDVRRDRRYAKDGDDGGDDHGGGEELDLELRLGGAGSYHD